MERILVVTVNWLGDALLTTPVFKSIKKKYPKAYVSVLCVESVKEVFLDNPWIDKVLIWHSCRGINDFIKNVPLIFQLRKEKYDTGFFIHKSLTRLLICVLGGIQNRIGFLNNKNKWLINEGISVDSFSLHRQEYYFTIFKYKSIEIEDRRPYFFVPYHIEEVVKEKIKDIRKEKRLVIGITPSANWVYKMWPEDNFVHLSDILQKDYGAQVIFFTSPAQTKIVDRIIMKMKTKPLNLSGKTNLKTLGAWLKNLDLFISSDTGVAHLASVFNTPSIVIFGPTAPWLTAPVHSNCKIIRKEVSCNLPCYVDNCRDNVCMKSIRVEDVLEVLKKERFI